MKGWIVTGASRGLGKGLVNLLLENKENLVISIARHLPPQEAPNSYPLVCDLTREEGLRETGEKIKQRLDKEVLTSLALINNAGVLAPVKPVASCSFEEIALNIRTNLIAPAQLTAFYLKELISFCTEHLILNISSGAAYKPYAGWSAYCASKAGLEHFTRTAALEQRLPGTRVTIAALAPGVVDTGMQSLIRETKEADFPLRNRFVELKEKGRLLSPEMAAEAIIKLIESKEIKNGDILDIRRFL